MPDVVPAECFLGLPPQERLEQLYWAAGGTLECFLGLDRRSQLEAFLEAVGAETCYGTEEDFWRNWAAELGVECIPYGMEDLQLAVYTALYDAAQDPELLPPECFLGAGPDGQLLALFDAAHAVYSVGYFITWDPQFLTLGSGESGDILVTLTLIKGDPQMATLTVPDLPSGWTAEFSDNPISTDGGTSTMTLTAP